MSQEPLFQVCLHNLKRQLEDLRKASEPGTRRSAENAMAYLTEIERFYSTAAEESPSEDESLDLRTGDTTDYKLYQLLASFGLSQRQLLAIAEAQGLHELRKLRMLRTVFEVSLPQAQATLADSNEGHDA